MSGRIYKIVGYGLTYYGSTTKTLNARKNGHKDNYERCKSGNTNYTSSYDILDQGDDWDIELVEEVEDKDKLLIREKYYIMNYECVNKCVPGRTEEEKKEYNAQWREDNKEKRKEYNAQWYQENKEKIAQRYEANKEYHKEYHAQWREANKDHIKEKKAQYYEANKEKRKEKKAQYHEKNRESILAKKRERVQCPHCDMDLNRSSLRRHIKTKHK